MGGQHVIKGTAQMAVGSWPSPVCLYLSPLEVTPLQAPRSGPDPGPPVGSDPDPGSLGSDSPVRLGDPTAGHVRSKRGGIGFRDSLVDPIPVR